MLCSFVRGQMVKGKFNDEQINLLKNEYLNGKTVNQIAKETNSNFYTIKNALSKVVLLEDVHKRWTETEINFLKDNYSSSNWNYILENLPNRNKGDIISKASSLNLKRTIFFWSEEDISILKQAYQNKIPVKQISVLFNGKFSETSILTKANKLGLRQREFWSDSEINLLCEIYGKLDMNEICEKFPNRTKSSIINQAEKLGLSYKTTWTKDELMFLKNNYDKMTDSEIGEVLGRSSDSIRGKRFIEKLYHPVPPGSYDYLSEYIRKRNKVWKKKSSENCGYRCAVTGNRFQAIHHLYGMNMILAETLEELGYDTNIEIDKLNEDDLNLILNHFYIVQGRYPYGICLSSYVHKQFHNEYGYGYNTPEQFQDFLEKHNYKIA